MYPTSVLQPYLTRHLCTQEWFMTELRKLQDTMLQIMDIASDANGQFDISNNFPQLRDPCQLVSHSCLLSAGLAEELTRSKLRGIKRNGLTSIRFVAPTPQGRKEKHRPISPK